MKNFLIISFTLLPSTAFAHYGHLGEALGHDHWLGAAAIGTAIALGLLNAVKGSKKRDEEEQEEVSTEEGQEA
ncbi:hypothetical protein F9L33_08955 [Amylibacter sp. SFDW26]|nr:hypothetical protein F9L33_08955 [Amylibacter sp. SFDW26]